MTIEELEAFYGNSYRFEKKTGMSHGNFPVWKKLGYIPIFSQMKLERLTKGALKASLDHCLKR